MTRRRIAACLGAAMALQLFLLAGMVAGAALPLWTGTEIRVETVPVDPRSMFRGNYARLRYRLGTLPDDALGDVSRLRRGEIVYVSLRRADTGYHVFAAASLERPSDGVFLRGRVVRGRSPYRLNYGIEAFFAPKERALKLEKHLRNGGTAILMVTASGQAAIKDIVPRAGSE